MNSIDDSTSAAEPARVADRDADGAFESELNVVTVIGVTIRYIYVAAPVIMPSIILNRKNRYFFTGTSPSAEKI
jgi:hypothetical protein